MKFAAHMDSGNNNLLLKAPRPVGKLLEGYGYNPGIVGYLLVQIPVQLLAHNLQSASFTEQDIGMRKKHKRKRHQNKKSQEMKKKWKLPYAAWLLPHSAAVPEEDVGPRPKHWILNAAVHSAGKNKQTTQRPVKSKIC